MKPENKDKRTSSAYLEKRSNYPPLLTDPIASHVSMIVVIPSYQEEDLFDTLHSLSNCDMENLGIEVIIVLNSSADDTDAVRNLHRKQHDELKQSNWPFQVYPILLQNIPPKRAGVGYARKAGMDEALRRLSTHRLTDGLIICLDADCTVAPNYFRAIHEHFSDLSSPQAGHLYFEHRFPEDIKNRKAIVEYELHLRLMKLQIELAGHPQAYHAVGSCLVVKAIAYAEQGGMNARKAGEDFYFIHKFSRIGQLSEIRETTVFPAARSSFRVPFGTGAAVRKALYGEVQETYAYESYEQLAGFCKNVPKLYDGEDVALTFLDGFKEVEAKQKIKESIQHTSDKNGFIRRYYAWFDAFQVIKYLHHLRDTKFKNIPVQIAAEQFISRQYDQELVAIEDQLHFLRKIENSPRKNIGVS